MNFVAWQVWNWVALVVGLGVAAAGAYLLARWSWRWLVAAVVAVACVLFLLVLPARYPSSQFLDPDLPAPFLDHFWAWVLVFVLGLIFSALFLVRTLRAARPASRAEAGRPPSWPAPSRTSRPPGRRSSSSSARRRSTRPSRRPS